MPRSKHCIVVGLFAAVVLWLFFDHNGPPTPPSPDSTLDIVIRIEPTVPQPRKRLRRRQSR